MSTSSTIYLIIFAGTYSFPVRLFREYEYCTHPDRPVVVDGDRQNGTETLAGVDIALWQFDGALLPSFFSCVCFPEYVPLTYSFSPLEPCKYTFVPAAGRCGNGSHIAVVGYPAKPNIRWIQDMYPGVEGNDRAVLLSDLIDTVTPDSLTAFAGVSDSYIQE